MAKDELQELAYFIFDEIRPRILELLDETFGAQSKEEFYARVGQEVSNDLLYDPQFKDRFRDVLVQLIAERTQGYAQANARMQAQLDEIRQQVADLTKKRSPGNTDIQVIRGPEPKDEIPPFLRRAVREETQVEVDTTVSQEVADKFRRARGA